MKNFYFREILLASFREKRGRRVQFHPKATIIRGENETGKSSLIKSLFITFGADPSKIHPNWEQADVRSVVRFDVDGESYALLRHGSMFAAFDGKDRLIARFSSVTKDLAPFLAKLFDFGLRLPNRKGAPIPLPPAYFFLPYYMDQDGSWGKQWTGFAKLEQFANWKKALVEFHAGIRGNRYYEAQAVKLDSETALSRTTKKREGLSEVYDSLGERFEAARFNVDFSAYQAEVEALLSKCQRLRQQEEQFKENLSDLRNARGRIKTQLDITKHAREEARKDYEFAVSTDSDDEVHCPTCGAGYANSFADRFAIAVDEDQCADLALRLTDELATIDAKIEKELEAARRIGDSIGEIEKLLAKREGEVALGDLIQQEGRRELREVMTRDLSALETDEGRLRFTIEEQRKRMQALDSRDHRQTVNGAFADLMRAFLEQLDARSVAERSFQKVDAEIGATGSELPRALLAYKLAFLHVQRRFGSAASGPLVIDSPNQQDQDAGHHERILNFLRTQRPEGTQLILGLVDNAGVKFEGTEVVLDKKYRLLRDEEFDDVGVEVTRYIDRTLAAR